MALIQLNPPEFDVQAECLETCDPIEVGDRFASEEVDDHLSTCGLGPTGAISVETLISCAGALEPSRCAMRGICKISTLSMDAR